MEKHYGKPSNCPFCGSHEDTAHVFSCNHDTPRTCRNKAISSLATKLTKNCNTSGPKWAAATTRAISELGGDTPTNQMIFTHPSTQQQQDIGWLNFLQGRITKNIWTTIETNPNSTTGITKIKALWKLASILWRCRNRKKHGKTPQKRVT
jgi:hypothetical protein